MQRTGKRSVNRTGRRPAECFGYIPQQLVKLAHNREDPEHLGSGLRGHAPINPAVGVGGDLLPGAKAVIHGASAESGLPQPGMDSAAEVRLQIDAGLSGGFVNGEVGRSGKWQRGAA
ncbi:hypothetical protein D3C73_912990 [compost metagenome]